MNIKGKFMAMIAAIGVILITVSAIGYYNAQKQLVSNIEDSMNKIVDFQADEVSNWLHGKARQLDTVSKVVEKSARQSEDVKNILSSIKDDTDVQDIYVGRNADGLFVHCADSEIPAGFDPRGRGWYKAAWDTGTLVFTDVYVDILTNKQVVTVSQVYKEAAGNRQGVAGMDIALDIMKEQVKTIQLNGEGEGMIIDRTGTVIAHLDGARVAQKLEETSAFKDHMKEILTEDNGSFTFSKDGKEYIFAYAKVHGIDWVAGLEIPSDVVFKELHTLRINYIVLTLAGILLMLVLGLKFANGITEPIVRVTRNAEKLAEGNLQVERLTINSKDEIARMAGAFNAMAEHLRGLIQKVSGSAEQIAASSEELTAGAAQSAETANNVAGTVTQVAAGMENQMVR